MNEEQVLPFLKDYAKFLLDFDFPEGDFPLFCKSDMPGGRMIIETVDGRHVATIRVEGDNISPPSMPLGPAALFYAKLFVELANGLRRIQRTTKPKNDSPPQGVE